MRIKTRQLAAAITTMVLGMTSTSGAATITFTTSGASGVSGNATFTTIGDAAFSVTLENLTDPISRTAQELDGLSFRLAPAGAPTLTSVDAVEVIDCSADHSVPCPTSSQTPPANYGWLVNTSGGLTTLAPKGYHPYAIVNDFYQLPKNGNGNIANPQHNPFLLGPVVFTFAGTFTGVSDLTFYWGTVPGTTTGICIDGCAQVCAGSSCNETAVPEPASLLLLGVGLVMTASRLRKRQ